MSLQNIVVIHAARNFEISDAVGHCIIDAVEEAVRLANQSEPDIDEV